MHHEPRGLVQHQQVFVLEHDVEWEVQRRDLPPRLFHREVHADEVEAGERAGGPGDLLVHVYRAGRQKPGGLRAGQGELVGEEAVQALGRGRGDLEEKRRSGRGDQRYEDDETGAAAGSSVRSFSGPSDHRTTASTTAPHVTAMSATLNVGHR